MVRRSTLQHGGTVLSPSMLRTWWTCPRLYYWQYLHPRDDGQGIDTQYTGSPLLVGAALHEGLEGYYRSGWRDGNYQLDHALTWARKCFAARRDEFATSEQYTDDLALTEGLLRNYADFYGPDGQLPEYPTTKIVTDDKGEPLIEHSYEVPIGDTGYTLLVRPDLVVSSHGYVCVMEHKSSAASSASRLSQRAQMDAQFMAEVAILNEMGVPANGVLLNILVKNRSARSKEPAFMRDQVHYSPDMVKRFLTQVEMGVRNIIEAVGGFHGATQAGMGWMDALNRYFPLVGLHTGACVQWSRCAMFPLCSAPGREDQSLRDYRTRQYNQPTGTEDTA